MELSIGQNTRVGQPRREVLKVEAVGSATWQGTEAEVYDYLSELERLLTGIPGLHRLQLAREAKMARLHMTAPRTMGQQLKLVIDLQAHHLPEQRAIILTSYPRLQTQVFGPCPDGHIPTNFQAHITAGPGRASNSLVTVRVGLGLDELPAGLERFANAFLLSMVRGMVQDHAQKIIARLMQSLQQGYMKQQMA